jgi:hypothetical protein
VLIRPASIVPATDAALGPGTLRARGGAGLGHIRVVPERPDGPERPEGEVLRGQARVGVLFGVEKRNAERVKYSAHPSSSSFARPAGARTVTIPASPDTPDTP